MKPRNLLARLALLGWLIWSASSFSTATAQDAFRAVDLPAASMVADVLDRGDQLESESRWGEALTHYEEAARKHPENTQLQHRLLSARLHYDLGRRYGDPSYQTLLSQLSEQQAVSLYSEVVLKIQSRYVHEPNWNELLQHGTQAFEIALHDAEFQKAHGVASAQGEAASLLGYVRQVLGERDVRDRRQAEELVRWIGRLSARRLNVNANVVIMEYMCGAMNSLDSYSTYLTADQLDEVYSQIEGNFVGLGIELKGDEGTLLIANVIDNGPADRAGLQAGDRITAVDGTAIQDMPTDRAADLLKGEQGSYVEVTLRAPSGEMRRVHVRRERVEVPSVEDARIVDSEAGVAYFRISSFQKTTSRDVDAALWKLHREGMRSLIIDVRGNPGGLLNEAVEVADRFVVEGTIVATHGRSVHENYDYKAHRVGTWRVPLVVLIDGDSASASEIFAGAIRDHQRGTIVGDRSYGKGSVQGIFPLRTVKGGVRLTTAKFYSPSGRAISLGGVEPNVTVQTVLKPGESSYRQPPADDEVLAAGTQIARKLIAARLQHDASNSQSVQADVRSGQVFQRGG